MAETYRALGNIKINKQFRRQLLRGRFKQPQRIAVDGRGMLSCGVGWDYPGGKVFGTWVVCRGMDLLWFGCKALIDMYQT